ncbi:ATP-dependent helicase [Archangium lansingense]|uniref:ATP-dependent helicase n=1 Tax=Archangium lansingense TaxID=2995310 RepID=UPI003B81170F
MNSFRAAARELLPNREQWQAYESQGHLVVLAGPGSGKTKLLTVKLARIAEEEIDPPHRIACLTYNNECVSEIRKRLVGIGVRPEDRFYLGTVHSFCLSEIVRPFSRLAGLLLPSPVRVAPEHIQEKCLQAAVNRFGRGQDVTWFRPEIDCYRRTHLNRDRPDWRGDDSSLASIVEEYERLLRAEGFVDFDDMVLLAVQILERHRVARRAVSAKYPTIAVDEYQDLGLPLHRIVELLCFQSASRLFAVGDPDQSIYGFTGARPEMLLDLSRRIGVTPVRLKKNYRSGQSIMAAAEAALGEFRGYTGERKDVGRLEVRQCIGGIEDQCNTAIREIVPALMRLHPELCLGDVAILYPSKREGEYLAEACRASAVPFVRNDRGSPYSRTRLVRWLEDAAAWVAGRTLMTPRWEDLLDRWVSLCGHGGRLEHEKAIALRQRVARFLWRNRMPEMPLSQWISVLIEGFEAELSEMKINAPDDVASLEGLKELSQNGLLQGCTILGFAFAGGSPDALNLLTLHSSKGLEFEVVVMVGLDEGVIPRYRASERGVAESRRLFYVGLTRAMRHVVFVYSGFTVDQWGRRHRNGPSRFVRELLDRSLVEVRRD